MSLRVLRCVLKHLAAKGLDRLVLIQLADHAHDDGTGIWAAQPTLAEETGLHRATVQRCLGRLKAARLIQPDGRGKHSTLRWRIVLCDDCALSAAQSGTKQKAAKGAAQSGTKHSRALSAAQSGSARRTERHEPIQKGSPSGGTLPHRESGPPAPPQAAGGPEPATDPNRPSPAESTRAERWSVLSKPPPRGSNGMTPAEEAARRDELLAQIKAMTNAPDPVEPR